MMLRKLMPSGMVGRRKAYRNLLNGPEVGAGHCRYGLPRPRAKILGAPVSVPQVSFKGGGTNRRTILLCLSSSSPVPPVNTESWQSGSVQ